MGRTSRNSGSAYSLHTESGSITCPSESITSDALGLVGHGAPPRVATTFSLAGRAAQAGPGSVPDPPRASVVASLPRRAPRDRMGHGRHPVRRGTRAAAQLADGGGPHHARRRRRGRRADARGGCPSGRHRLPAVPGRDPSRRRERGPSEFDADVFDAIERLPQVAASTRPVFPFVVPADSGLYPFLDFLAYARAGAAGAQVDVPRGARGTTAAPGSRRRDRGHRTLRRRSRARDRRSGPVRELRARAVRRPVQQR